MMTKVQRSTQRGNAAENGGFNIAIDSDNTIPFHSINIWSSKKSDEEIVASSNYKFNLPIEDLINNSGNTRLAKRNQRRERMGTDGTDIEVPRRQNAWVLYLRDKSPEFKGFQPGKIAKMWNNEPAETVEVFEALVRMSIKRHKEKYGEDYTYKPRPSKQKQNTKKLKKKSQSRNKEEPNMKEFLPTPATSNLQSPVIPIEVFEETSLPTPLTSSEEHHFPTPATSLSEELDEPTAYTEQQLLPEVTPNVYPENAGHCQPVEELELNLPVPNFDFPESLEHKECAPRIFELIDTFSPQAFFAYLPASEYAFNAGSIPDWVLYPEIEGLDADNFDNLKDIGETNNP